MVSSFISSDGTISLDILKSRTLSRTPVLFPLRPRGLGTQVGHSCMRWPTAFQHSDCGCGDFRERRYCLDYSHESGLFSRSRWEGIPVYFGKQVNETERLHRIHWSPFPFLAYLQFLTLEGVSGQSREQSFGLISATRFTVYESEEPILQKLCVTLCKY